MEHVYESRWLQEQTLAKTLKDPEIEKEDNEQTRSI